MKRHIGLMISAACLFALLATSAFGATVTVHVFNFNFSTNPFGQPIAEPTIHLGDTIHWEWDSGTHTSTSVKGSIETWDSGALSMGATFAHTFTHEGVIVYYCKIHGTDNGNGTASGMHGMVTVVNSVKSLTLSPSSVTGSENVIGTVILDAPAPAGGFHVMLANTNSAATVPSSVMVPAGLSSTKFTITTKAVTITETGTVTASLNGLSHSATLKVEPIGVGSFTLSATTVKGGNSVTGTVKLQAPAAPGNIVVTFTSSNTTVVPAPANITIPAGSQSHTVTITTKAVTANTTVTLSATANGVTKSVKLTVTP